MTKQHIAVACGVAAALAAPARAADPTTPSLDGDPAVAEPAVVRRGAEGHYLPLTLAPTVGASAAVATGYGGYDGARGTAVMVSYAEVRVWGPIALRGGAELSDTLHRLRPSIGARMQLLSQQRHGVDGAISVSYRPEGFSEPEGEIETVASVGRRMGRATLLGNLAYGQDPEARERDGEVRAAALLRLGQRGYAGVDGRWRFDLGSESAKLIAAREPRYDLDVGPVAAVWLGPVALMAHAGLSVLRRVGESARVGAIAMGGAGTAF